MDLSKRPEGATHYSETGDTWYRIPSELGGYYDYMRNSEYVDKWIVGRRIKPIYQDLNPIVDWSTAPDNATHALTTGTEWDGAISSVGSIRFAYLMDENYYDANERETLVWFEISNHEWIVLEQRPEIEDAIKHMHDTSPTAHYDKYIYRVNIKPEDAERGYIDVKLDPYRVGKVCGVGGGALEQCLKKAMRGTDKGHGEKRVLEEIISAAKRGLEMIEEDEG